MTTQTTYKDVMMKVVTSDGIHLNKAGNDAVGVAFARFLQGNGF
jgi:hypothetical protein